MRELVSINGNDELSIQWLYLTRTAHQPPQAETNSFLFWEFDRDEADLPSGRSGFGAGHRRVCHSGHAGRAEGRHARNGWISGQGGGLAPSRRPDEAAAAQQIRVADQERSEGVSL